MSFLVCAIAFASCTKKATESTGTAPMDTTTLAPTTEGETNVATGTAGSVPANPPAQAVEESSDDFPADEGSWSDDE